MQITKGGNLAPIARVVSASGVPYDDSGGYFGGGSPSLQEILDLIGAGLAPGAFLLRRQGGGDDTEDLGTMGAAALADLGNASVFYGVLDQDCTITTVGWLPSGRNGNIRVELIQDGTGGWTPTFSGVTWIGGTPTWDTTAGTVTHVVLFSRDGGTTIYGAVVGAGGSGSSMWFNVLDYGAVADSSTDCRAAIVAADAAAAAVGGIVYFPASDDTYYVLWSAVRHSLKPSAGVTWLGDGMFASVIEIDPGSTISTSSEGQPVIEIGTATVGADKIRLQDLGVIGNYSTLGGANKYIQGIWAFPTGDQSQHSDDITIERVRVYDVNAGIGAGKGTVFTPLATNRHKRWTIKDCLVELSNNKAIELDQAEDSQIVGNTTIACMDGLQVLNYTARTVVLGNVVEYKDGGINVSENVSDIEIGDNVCTAIAGGGIGFNGGLVIRRESYATAGATSSRVNIHDNVFNDSGNDAATTLGIRFATYAANTGVAVFEDYEIANNLFIADENYLYDDEFPAKSSAVRLRIFDNYFSGDAITNASWVSDRTRFERNHVTANFDALTDNWDFRGNVWGGTFTLTATGCTLDDGYIRNVLVAATPPSSGQSVVASSATAAAWGTPALDPAAVEVIGHYELLMAAGITSPPEPLENGAGDDWLFVWVPG